MSRNLIIKIHLVLACLYLPLMLLMPFTGISYLLGFKGEETKTEVFRTNNLPPESEDDLKNYFKKELEARGFEAHFEYVRKGGADYILRPTTRTYFMAKKESESEVVFQQVTPNLMKRLIELHKGHGPVMMRWFEISFGVALILTALSGLWLAVTAPTYQKMAGISFLMGSLVIAFCLL